MSVDLAHERDLEYERDWHEGDDVRETWEAECTAPDCGEVFETYSPVGPVCPVCGRDSVV
jgi:hypothetical protein